MAEIKTCPCGQPGSDLFVSAFNNHGIHMVGSDCYMEWFVQFFYPTGSEKTLKEVAEIAWNSAKRNET